MTGIIFHIQRFSTGDGPGIRTTVFFKGCPLSCRWCHNPESQKTAQQLAYYKQKCISCGVCAMACSKGNIHICKGGNIINFSACDACGNCKEACPTDALWIFGQRIELDVLLEELCRDRSYYGKTGGVTLSGGEPCMQSSFAAELLYELKQRGINTALDTCGACSMEKIEPLLYNTDLVLFDLKHMDTVRHMQMTGMGNEVILENFKKIHAHGNSIRVRVPVIPGYNDTRSNWDALTSFLKPYPNVPVELLAYHKLGYGKYESIGKTYEMSEFRTPKSDEMQAHRLYLQGNGLECL